MRASSAAAVAHPPSPWPIRAAAVALVLALLAVYANSLAGPFVFDDGPAIAGNPSIRDLTAFGRVLSPPPADGQTVGGRPVVNLSLALNYAWGGTAPRGYHVVNFLIHACAALTLFGVVRRTFLQPALAVRFGAGATPLALAIAALWALHPLLTESVTYIIQRAESLMSLFYLLTLYAFIRGIAFPRPTDKSRPTTVRTGWALLAFGACLLGMATKEVMVSAPLLVLLYDRTFVATAWRETWTQRGKFHLALAGTWLLLAWLVHRAGNRGGTAGLGAGDSPWAYALTQSRAIVHYLRLAAWPQPLVFDYGMHLTPTLAAAAPFAVVVVALLAGVIVALRRWPRLGFLGAWFFALLAPSSSFVPIAVQPMAEHRMYLPLAAIAVLVGIAIHERCRRFAWIVFGLLAAGLGAATVLRNADYRSEIALWSATVAQRPANARAQCQLGLALTAAGRIEEALSPYAEAVRLEAATAQPGERTLLGEYLVNYGNALFQLGRSADAERVYRDAINQDAASREAHFNLGCLLMTAGRRGEAEERFTAALRLDPDYSSAHTNLGNVLLQAGRPHEAIAHFEAVARLEPGPKAHANLALALLQDERVTEAVAQLEQALRLDPDYAKAHEFYGDALRLQDRPAEAAAHYERALRLDPDNARARDALASLRSRP